MTGVRSTVTENGHPIMENLTSFRKKQPAYVLLQVLRRIVVFHTDYFHSETYSPPPITQAVVRRNSIIMDQFRASHPSKPCHPIGEADQESATQWNHVSKSWYLPSFETRER